MADLKTDYIDPEWEGERSYIKTTNTDGTVSFTDATAYINSGDYIGADDINTTNAAVNEFANTWKSWIGGSFTSLKTNYVDSEFEGKKKFKMTDNGDDTVSLEDVTVYTTQGTEYGADDINATNTLINSLTNGLEEGLTDIADLLQSLGATDVSDLIAAIDTMVSVQTTNGTAQGKTDVTSNPNAYGLYTPAQYNSASNNTNVKAQKIKSAASTLTPCATNSTYWTTHVNAVNSETKEARQLANTIVKNMDEAAARIARSNCLRGAQGINAASYYADFKTDVNSALNILRS